MFKNKTIIFMLVAGLCTLSAQNYKVGDYVADFTDSLCTASAEWTLYDYYGDLNGGDYSVIWLVFFNTTSRRCQLEAAYSQTIQDMYEDQGLVTVGIGSGWSDTYDCKDWAKNYSVTYPIIDDDRANLKSLFADGTVPHHVIIDHNMQVVYTAKGTIIPPLGNDFLITLSTALQNMNVLSTINESMFPNEPKLNSCYPNPFNNTTKISYVINAETPVSINVLDLQGKIKNSLISLSSQSPGSYSFSWNADQYASGVYFIQLVTKNNIQHQKVLLVK
jgi:hypothetical protein